MMSSWCHWYFRAGVGNSFFQGAVLCSDWWTETKLFLVSLTVNKVKLWSVSGYMYISVVSSSAFLFSSSFLSLFSLYLSLSHIDTLCLQSTSSCPSFSSPGPIGSTHSFSPIPQFSYQNVQVFKPINPTTFSAVLPLKLLKYSAFSAKKFPIHSHGEIFHFGSAMHYNFMHFRELFTSIFSSYFLNHINCQL